MPVAVIEEDGGGSPAVDSVQETFGAPDTAFEFDTTSLAGLTALNSPTMEDADTTIPGHLYLRQAAAAGVTWRGRYVAQAVPFTVITKVSAYAGSVTWNSAGLFVSDATPGGMHVFAMANYADHAISRRVTQWSDSVGGGGSVIVQNPLQQVVPTYLMIVANSSDDLDFWYSSDGWAWTLIWNDLNPSYTVGACGLAISAEAASFGVAAGFDYLRVWDSVLTPHGSPT